MSCHCVATKSGIWLPCSLPVLICFVLYMVPHHRTGHRLQHCSAKWSIKLCLDYLLTLTLLGVKRTRQTGEGAIDFVKKYFAIDHRTTFYKICKHCNLCLLFGILLSLLTATWLNLTNIYDNPFVRQFSSASHAP